MVPLGYAKKKGSQNIPEIAEKEADIIKRIFNMYTLEKRTLSDIATLLNREGYRTRRGGLFETRTVGYILENPFYIGRIRWNYFDKKQNKRKREEDVIISRGNHAPSFQKNNLSRQTVGWQKNAPAQSMERKGLLPHPATGFPAYINEIDTLEEYRQNKADLFGRAGELRKSIAQAEKDAAVSATRQKRMDCSKIMEALKNDSMDSLTKANALRQVIDWLEWNQEARHLNVVLAR